MSRSFRVVGLFCDPVLTLVCKSKKATNLLVTGEDAYARITVSASDEDLLAWHEGECTAQDSQQEDFKSMDYYALRTKRGMWNISSVPCLLINNAFFEVPGKVEVQLELSEKWMSSGRTSVIELLSEGMAIQEAQYISYTVIQGA